MTPIWQMSKHPLEVKGAKSETRWAQPRDKIFSPLPTSIAFIAITTGGKTSQMLHVADRIFNQMDRVVIFSHSHRLDPAWHDLKKRIADKMLKNGENPDVQKFAFESFKELPRILSEQRERVQAGKDRGDKHLPQLLILAADMLGEMQGNKILSAVVTRGRHYGVSLLCDSQTVRGIDSQMRKNLAGYCLGRLSAADWTAFEDENTTFVTREQLREMYQRAVGHKFGFLYYRPRSGDVENMFYDAFTQRLIPS